MQPVQHKGLLWAQHLRSQILERIAALKAALADIEPLREELARLEAQLRGVDRLIAIQIEGVGQPADVAERGGTRAPATRQTDDASPLPPWSAPGPNLDVDLPTWHGLLLGEIRMALRKYREAAHRFFVWPALGEQQAPQREALFLTPVAA